MQTAGHESPEERRTRMIVMGDPSLTDGFALVGFETFPNATEGDLEALLNELVRRQESALILLGPELARCECDILDRVRNEGGHIVVTEVPPLYAPEQYHPMIEDLVVSVLGPGALRDNEP
jgi:vacuolar-type H+-ATPase subunit F/Vma7